MRNLCRKNVVDNIMHGAILDVALGDNNGDDDMYEKFDGGWQ
jgi:hypothetical protein